MTGETARRELREARDKGLCDYCFVSGTPGEKLDHLPGCKIVNDAGTRRRLR